MKFSQKFLEIRVFSVLQLFGVLTPQLLETLPIIVALFTALFYE